MLPKREKRCRSFNKVDLCRPSSLSRSGRKWFSGKRYAVAVEAQSWKCSCKPKPEVYFIVHKMTSTWTQANIGRAWDTQPLDKYGDPAWFAPEHFTWLEKTLRLDNGEALGRIWTSGTELVDRAEAIVDSCNPEMVRHDLAEPVNRFGQKAWFTPEHNAWLEEVYGWEEGSVLQNLWQEDAELIEQVEELFYQILTSSDEALALERQYVRAEIEQAKQHLAENSGDIARVWQTLGALVAQLGGAEEVYASIERYKERLEALESLGSPGRTYQLAVNAGLASPRRHPDLLESVQQGM